MQSIDHDRQICPIVTLTFPVKAGLHGPVEWNALLVLKHYYRINNGSYIIE